MARLFEGEVVLLMRRAWSLGLLSRKNMATLFGCSEDTIYRYCLGVKRKHKYHKYQD